MNNDFNSDSDITSITCRWQWDMLDWSFFDCGKKIKTWKLNRINQNNKIQLPGILHFSLVLIDGNSRYKGVGV